MTLQRRRLLELCGTATVAGLAGCLGDSMPGGDDPSHEHIEDDTVDYAGLVDGSATVTTEEVVRIQYDDPETSFILQGVYQGEQAADTDLRAQQDLSGETMAGFIAPVHTGEAFEYHVFANEAFVDFADWNVLVGAGENLTDSENPGFERVDESVYGMVLSPDDTDLLAVVDATAEELRSNDGAGPTGLAIINDAAGSQPEQTVPQISFGFEYEATAERLTVTHEGGDNVEASRLRFQSDTETTVESDFEGTVRAGDTATLSVPSDATVRIVWTSEQEDRSATLAEWQGSDA